MVVQADVADRTDPSAIDRVFVKNKLGEKQVGGMSHLEEKLLNVSECYSRVIRN